VLSRSSWIKVGEFCDKYNCSINSIHAGKFNGRYPPSVFKFLTARILLINENWFLRRVLFVRKVWLEAHDAYYFLTKHLSIFELSTLLCKIDDSKTVESWNVFFNKSLFSPLNDNIVNVFMSMALYKFHRHSRWLIRGLFIISGRFVLDRKKVVNNILDNY